MEEEMEEPSLEECYNFVYFCEKCEMEYGSDKKELTTHICPLCSDEKMI